MTKEAAFGSEIFEEAVRMLQKIPAADRGVSFENNSRRTALTVHGDTAFALMFILDNVEQFAAGIRNVHQVRQSLDRAEVMKRTTELRIPDADSEFFERVRQLLVNFDGRVVLAHIDEMSAGQRRIDELLEANNRYLQEARDARAELKAHKEKHGHGN